MVIEEIPSPVHPEKCVSLALYDNVQNCKELKKLAMEGNISACLIRPSMVLDKFQVLVAGIQAINHDVNEKRITKVLQTELLYCLSPTKNISDAFNKFGMANNDTQVLVTEIHAPGESHMEEIKQLVEGELVGIDKLKDMSDQASVKKVYKIPDPELRVGSLLEAVVCRIAGKDMAT